MDFHPPATETKSWVLISLSGSLERRASIQMGTVKLGGGYRHHTFGVTSLFYPWAKEGDVCPGRRCPASAPCSLWLRNACKSLFCRDIRTQENVSQLQSTPNFPGG